MDTKTAIEHFGSQAALARALGVKQPSLASWGARPPWRRQLQIEDMTHGALQHHPEDIPVDMRALVYHARQSKISASQEAA